MSIDVIYDDLLKHEIDKEWLREVEFRDNIFSDIDCAKHYMVRSKRGKSNIRKKSEIKITCPTS